MIGLMRYLLFVLLTLLMTMPTQAEDDLFLLSLSYSPDGEYVVGVGNRIVVWDAETAQIVVNITLELESPQSLLMDASWSPDGDRLAVAGDDFKIRILDFSSAAEPIGALLTEFEVTTFMGVRSIAWAPDGGLIVIGGDEVRPRLEFRNGITYDYIRSSAFVVGAYRIAWHPNLQRNLLAVTNGYLNGAQLASTVDANRTTWVCGACSPDAIALPVAWSHDGSLLAIGHTDGGIFILNPFTDTVVTQIQAGEYVSELVWTQNSQYLVSLSQAGVQVWDSLTGSLLNTPPFPNAGEIAIHPFRDDLFIYTGVGNIISIATLIAPTSTPTPTFTPTLTPTPTFTPTPTLTNTPTPSVICTATVAANDALGLVNAINAANNNGASADTICLALNSTYTFATGQNAIALPSITTPITIVGNGAVLERGSGAPQFRLFNVTSSGSLTLQNLTVRNGNASGGNGGAILNTGSVNLSGVMLSGNSARYGGGIYSSGTLTITGSTLTSNSGVEDGGAIYLNNGSLTMSDTTVQSSSARYGSGIYANDGTVSLSNVTFRTNTANEQGAGLFQRRGTATVSGGTFDGNNARFGSAIYVRGALSVTSAAFTNNVAVEEGAAIYNENGNQSAVTVTTSTFTGNRARYGSSIYNRARLNVTNSTFSTNTATESGGAVYHQNGNTQNGIAQSCFTGNTARFGGAVFSQTGNFNAQNNWWGAAAGPTSAMVNNQVQTTPFLTAGCPN